MLSVEPIRSAGGAAHYFAEKAVAYYANDTGESRWLGQLTASLELSGAVEKAPLSRILAGQLPNGEQLGRTMADGAKKHRPGYELCFSVPKSVSIMAEIGGDERLLAATWQAVERVMDFIERQYISARVTTDGDTQFVATGQLAAAAFMHHASRENDPQVHIHVLISNITQTADGVFRALATSRQGQYGHKGIETVFKKKKFLGKLFRNELAHQIKQTTDYVLHTTTDRHGDSYFDIVGVPETVMANFSTRRQQIIDKLSTFASTSARAAQAANLLTREDKSHGSLDSRRALWQAAAKTLSFEPSMVKGDPAYTPTVPLPENTQPSTIPTVISTLTEKVAQLATHINTTWRDSRDAKSANRQPPLWSSQAAASVVSGATHPSEAPLSCEVLVDTVIDAAVEACLAATGEFTVEDILNDAISRAFATVSIDAIETAVDARIKSGAWLSTEDKRLTTPAAITQHSAFLSQLAGAPIKPLLSVRQYHRWAKRVSTAAVLKPLVTSNARVQAIDVATLDRLALVHDWVDLVHARDYLPVVIAPNRAQADGLAASLDRPIYTVNSFVQAVQSKRFKAYYTPRLYVVDAHRVNKAPLVQLMGVVASHKKWGIVLSGDRYAPPIFGHQTAFHTVCEQVPTTSWQRTPPQAHTQPLRYYVEKTHAARTRSFTQGIVHSMQTETPRVGFASGRQIASLTGCIRAELKAIGVLAQRDSALPLLAPHPVREASHHDRTYQPGTFWWVGHGLGGVRANQWVRVTAFDAAQQQVRLQLQSSRSVTLTLADCLDARGAIIPYVLKPQPIANGERLRAVRTVADNTLTVPLVRGDVVQVIATDSDTSQLIVRHTMHNKTFRLDLDKHPVLMHDYVRSLSQLSTLDSTDTAQLLLRTTEKASHSARHLLQAITHTNKVIIVTNDAALLQTQLSALQPVIPDAVTLTSPLTDAEKRDVAIDRAIDWLTMGHAAFQPDELLNATIDMHHNLGDCPVSAVRESIKARIAAGDLHVADQWIIPQVAIDCESRILAAIARGQGGCAPLITSKAVPDNLRAEQQRLFSALGASRDQFLLLQGYAGVGKTYLLKAIQTHVPYTVMGLSVTRTAVSEMDAHGIPATTVAYFLTHRLGETLTPKHLIIIDEASQLNNVQMLALVEQVGTMGARALLTGDDSQCKSIGAGDPLRLIFSAYPPQIAIDIQRQTTPHIRDAVKACINRDIPQAFTQLGERIIDTVAYANVNQRPLTPDEIDAIKAEYRARGEAIPESLPTHTRASRETLLARAWLSLAPDEREQVLLPSLTHADRLALCAAIRYGLAKEGTLTGEAAVLETLRPVPVVTTRYTAEFTSEHIVKVAHSIHPDLAIHQCYRIEAINRERNALKLRRWDAASKVTRSVPIWVALPGDKTRIEPFAVFEASPIEVQAGERLRLTENSPAWGMKKHEAFFISHINDGVPTVLLPDGSERVLDTQGHQPNFIDYHYVFTVYGVQGKTSQRVLCDFGAYNANADLTHFMVSISRAVESAVVMTNDKRALFTRLNEDAMNRHDKPIATHLLNQSPVFRPPPVALDQPKRNNPLPQSQSTHRQKRQAPAQPVALSTRSSSRTAAAPTYDRYDVTRLNEHLLTQITTWLPRMTDKPIKTHGQGIRIGQNKGSLVITIQGSHAGSWYDFAESRGGHLVGLIEQLSGATFKQALEVAAGITGLAPMPTSITPSPMPAVTTHKKQPPKDKHIDFAKRIVGESTPITGTLGETYLRTHRHITGELPNTLRFHPAIKRYPKHAARPGLVCPVFDAKGQLARMQITYLDKKTANKAAGDMARLTFGRGGTHGFVMPPDAHTTPSGTVILAEGVETGLSVRQAVPGATVIVVFGKAQLAKVTLPEKTTQVILACDNDGEATYLDAGYQKAIDACEQAQRPMQLIIPEKTGHDFNDVLKAGGVAAVKACLEKALNPNTYMVQRQYRLDAQAASKVAIEKASAASKAQSPTQKAMMPRTPSVKQPELAHE